MEGRGKEKRTGKIEVEGRGKEKGHRRVGDRKRVRGEEEREGRG